MINVNLTDEEKKELVNKTNEMIDELNFLSMDIDGLKKLISRITLEQRLFDTKNKDYYKLLERYLRMKSRRLLVLQQKIEENKEILGIKKVKKKKIRH